MKRIQRDKMFHVLIALCTEGGDTLGGVVRPGNVHTADGVEVFARNTVDLIERESRETQHQVSDAFAIQLRS